MEKSEIKIWNRYKRKSKWRAIYFHKVLKRHIFEKYFHYDLVMPRYAHKHVMGIGETNHWIYDKILSGEPFLVSRFGNTELQTMVYYLDTYEMENSKESEEVFREWFTRLQEGAGFFPANEALAGKFVKEMLSACKKIDMLAMWHCNMEDYFIDKYMKNTVLTYISRIESWRYRKPWSSALRGKKVLVIHPFQNTIRNQYSKRKLLFRNENVLPEFELVTLKAVQTIAGERDERFATWFEALEYMYTEAMKKEFDIAIIGCGAYGMPLAARLREQGKQVIHLGGATQLLFGIKGKRWIESPIIKLDFNDNWVYPSEDEKPKNSQNIEGGCYWN